MVKLASILVIATGLGAVVSGLQLLRIQETEAGFAALANLGYFLSKELFWRTKVARETMTKEEKDEEKKQTKEGEVYDRVTTLLCGLTTTMNALVCNVIAIQQNQNENSSTTTKAQMIQSCGGDEPRANILRAIAWSSIGAGFLIRRWSMLTLGNRFTMALATVKGHTVCREGPFRFVRHPGYFANGLVIISYAFLVTGRPKVVAASALAWLATWTVRIHCEEKMLKSDEHIGQDCQKYMTEVRSKFIPFIF